MWGFKNLGAILLRTKSACGNVVRHVGLPENAACKILNHAKFGHLERLPEADFCIALPLGFSGSPTLLTSLLKAVSYVRKMNPYFWKPHTSDYVAQGCFFAGKMALICLEAQHV